ncbi:MAG: hypothetical protein AVDCRST_MAG66-2082, partial [uncultured Pseudonocardia sp.]
APVPSGSPGCGTRCAGPATGCDGSGPSWGWLGAPRMALFHPIGRRRGRGTSVRRAVV